MVAQSFFCAGAVQKSFRRPPRITGFPGKSFVGGDMEQFRLQRQSQQAGFFLIGQFLSIRMKTKP